MSARVRIPQFAAIALAIAALAPMPSVAQVRARSAARPAHVARIRETTQQYPTYPFSDPDPIPAVGRIYPYFRFDGFSPTSTPKAWKVVELENDWIVVRILPEIGGKIWSAIEKSTGKPFIYDNHAVKFRDIAMRGPWTSGGIEINYGIIGHTPNVATPVDYATRTNADGSVSCIVGALDLLTMTTWRLEVRLAPDRAAFTTTSTWHNRSALEQPYYTWMTAGIPVAGGLRYVFPGTGWIGHEGERGTWPVNTTNGRDVSVYANNDFGGYKSYHVLGAAGDFFGAWWTDTQLGMARVAPRDEKPGQKIWIWGLSRQGMIWEDLLTDTDGQYSELQSGRLFNQTSEGSTRTPFKHRGFAPHLTDRWTEQWQPVLGTNGFLVASAAGALNVTKAGNRFVIALSPVEPIDDTLYVFVRGRLVHRERVVRTTLEAHAASVYVPAVPITDLRVQLGDHKLDWDGQAGAGALDRPMDPPPAFDWTSAYGHWLKGKELLRDREYARATAELDAALAREPHFVPALADRAMLALRAMQPEVALAFARRALAVDAYDGAANYAWGLANRRLGRATDARDGFEIASQSAELRAAATTELAKLWAILGDDRRALAYATKALAVDVGNLDALAIRVLVARRRGESAAWRRALDALAEADPLGVMAMVERTSGMTGVTPAAARAALRALHGEMPEQRLFDLAAWYQDVGDRTAAAAVLTGIGDHPEALYWRAALADSAAAPALWRQAEARDPRFVFPFRPEVIQALEHAVRHTTHWKARYYLALGLWATQRPARAAALLDALGDTVPFASLHAARATLPGRALDAQLADLARARALEPGEWRTARRLADRLLQAGRADDAVTVLAAAHDAAPANYMLGLSRVRALLEAGRVDEAARRLDVLHVLPYEGAGDGRALHRELALLRAVAAMRAGAWAQADSLVGVARDWPERLGAGKPYAADVDERLEDWLAGAIAAARADSAGARAAWERVTARRTRTGALADALVPWALERLGRAHEARTLLAEWQAAAPSDPVLAWAADRSRPIPSMPGTERRPLAAWLALPR